LQEWSAESLNMARKAGVRFLSGSDTGFSITPFGEWHARELELLVRIAGLSPLEAIQAATQNSALALGLEGQVGVVAPGMLADVIVVNGDPVRDIRVLQRKQLIEVVIKDGVRVQFDEPSEQVRWPFDRAQLISGDEITYAMIYEGASAGDGRDPVGWRGDEAEVMAAELRDAEVAAAVQPSWDN
jgi:hypothetical protein